jgi:hypothetical protein
VIELQSDLTHRLGLAHHPPDISRQDKVEPGPYIPAVTAIVLSARALYQSAIGKERTASVTVHPDEPSLEEHHIAVPSSAEAGDTPQTASATAIAVATDFTPMLHPVLRTCMMSPSLGDHRKTFLVCRLYG